MREILFRGKHIHLFPQNEHLNGTWVYGYLCDKNYINSLGLNGELLVDPSTIGQYTGLTDKNGKKIFEGDIVRHGERISIIAYIPQYMRFAGKRPQVIMAIFNFENSEVIGNIHDNPEMLEN